MTAKNIKIGATNRTCNTNAEYRIAGLLPLASLKAFVGNKERKYNPSKRMATETYLLTLENGFCLGPQSKYTENKATANPMTLRNVPNHRDKV